MTLAGAPSNQPDFLAARIAEDEEHAPGHSLYCAHLDPAYEDPPRDPADEEGCNCKRRRVLAECDAKRRLIKSITEDLYPALEYYGTPTEFDGLRLLALPYADHADYRDEWRP